MSRDAIKRCIAIVREVTKVLFSLPFMTIWPTVSIVWQLLIFLYLVVIGGFIATQDQATFDAVASAVAAQAAAAANATVAAVASAANGSDTGTLDVGSGASAATGGALSATDDALNALASLDNSVRIAILLFIHVTGCIWAYFMCVGGSYATLARSCAVWFFSHGVDESTQEVVQQGAFKGGVRVVLACAYCILTRHLGSIAFGAAILTIMTILRIILEAIDYYTKDQQESNLAIKLALKCAKCCLWCMDKTVKYITYYGYIFVAIEGTYFCAACFATFSFIVKYPAQMSVNALVAKLLSCAKLPSLQVPRGALPSVSSLADTWHPMTPRAQVRHLPLDPGRLRDDCFHVGRLQRRLRPDVRLRGRLHPLVRHRLRHHRRLQVLHRHHLHLRLQGAYAHTHTRTPRPCPVVPSPPSLLRCSHVAPTHACCPLQDLEEHTPPKFMSTDLRGGFGLETVTGGVSLEKEEGKDRSGSQAGTEMTAKM